MNIFNLFKPRIETGLEGQILQACATLYSDKIVVETIDRVKDGFGISSTKITLLPVDSAPSLLGLTIMQHLRLTAGNLLIPKDHKQHYADFLNKAGFKNGKEHHKNALLVNLYLNGNTISIIPTRNEGYTGKNRGFIGIKVAEIIVDADIGNIALGDQIKYGWTKCECNCI